MKTYLIVLLSLLTFSGTCFAQNESDINSDIVEITDNTESSNPETTNSSVIYEGASYNFMFAWKKKQVYDPHWTGFGMSFINFSDLKDVNMKMSASYSFCLNPMDYYLPIYHNWLLVTGLGIDWSRYHFKGDIGLKDNGASTDFEPSPDGTHYRSSKLLARYITIPLLIEYQRKVTRNKGFYLSGGIVGYVKCYSKSQIEYADTKQQVDLGRDLNILPVNARFMLQAGLNDISIFAYYSPFSLIEKGKGAELKPMGIGLRMDF